MSDQHETEGGAEGRRAGENVGTTGDGRAPAEPDSGARRARDAGASGDGGPARPGETPLSEASLEALVREQLRRLVEDPDREGLARSPERVADALRWLTRGYRMSPEEALGEGVFEERHDSMVLVKDIEVYSLCEHHLLPFFGKAHVAYIPADRLLGLSKIPRLVEVYARRLQVQERLTEQVAGALQQALEPQGVGVVVEAYHLCMMMRGVEKQNSKTITSAVRGNFRSDQRTREEFLDLVLSGQSVS